MIFATSDSYFECQLWTENKTIVGSADWYLREIVQYKAGRQGRGCLFSTGESAWLVVKIVQISRVLKGRVIQTYGWLQQCPNTVLQTTTCKKIRSMPTWLRSIARSLTKEFRGRRVDWGSPWKVTENVQAECYVKALTVEWVLELVFDTVSWVYAKFGFKVWTAACAKHNSWARLRRSEKRRK